MSLNIDPSSWRLRTLGGIPYKLMEGYPKGSFDEENGAVTEQYIIEASNLADFVEESFSDTTVIPGIVWLYRPARSYPGLAYLVSKKLDFVPYPPGKPGDPYGIDVGTGFGETYAQFLLVTIEYSSGKSDEGDQDAVEIGATATGEFLMYPAKNAKFESDSDEEGALSNPVLPLSKVIPSLEWSLKFRRIARSRMGTAVALARTMLGKVNSLPMPILMATTAETILFCGFSATTKWTWRDKDPFFEMELKMLEKVVNEDGEIKGHNHFYNPNTGLWEKLERTDSEGEGLGTYVYNLANLNQMFY